MRFVRGEVRDAYSRDGETVLMIDTTVLLLSPLASVIWDSCDSPASADEIEVVATGVFGAPPDGNARSHVDAALESLKSVGAIWEL
jgi:hypothetical protein